MRLRRKRAHRHDATMECLGRLTTGVLLILLTQLGTGCATMIRGQTSTVPVTSEPPGATIYVDGVRQTVQTPAKVTLSRLSHNIGLEKDGYTGRQQAIDTRFYWPATPWLILDIIPLGAGVPLDIFGGGLLELEPRQIHCGLVKAVETSKASDNPRLWGNRPEVPAGKGVIHVYHANNIPDWITLMAKVTAKDDGQKSRETDQHERPVTMDLPVTFCVAPGQYVITLRHIGATNAMLKEVVVEPDRVAYLRAMSEVTVTPIEAMQGTLSRWILQAESVPEREALTDLFYLSDFRRPVDKTPTAVLRAVPTTIEGTTLAGESK